MSLIRRLSTVVQKESEPFLRQSRKGTSGAGGIFSLDKCQERTTCLDDPTVVMAVKITVKKIKIVCIHPQNDSMPVFTQKFDGLKACYSSF
jgi:hypothetical protein